MENLAMVERAQITNTTKFTSREKMLFKHFEYFTGLKKQFSRVFVAINLLEKAEPTINEVALELKRRKEFTYTNFPRVLNALEKANYIRIFNNERHDRCLTITDSFINTILQM